MTSATAAARGAPPQPSATQRGRARLPLAAAASIALHAALVAAILRLPPGHVEPRVTPVSIEVVETPPARPASIAPPSPPAAPPAAVRAAPPVRRAAPAPRTAPPPPSAPTPPDRKAGPVRFGVSMSSTTEAGSLAAPVGGTPYGAAPPRAPDPSDAKPYRAERYAAPSDVSSLPVPVRVDVPKSEYPPDALREGFEGAVRLRLVVGEDGSVREAAVLSDPGRGLGAAAARVARRWFRFRPALKDGVPVATEIPFTIEFRLQ